MFEVQSLVTELYLSIKVHLKCGVCSFGSNLYYSPGMYLLFDLSVANVAFDLTDSIVSILNHLASIIKIIGCVKVSL